MKKYAILIISFCAILFSNNINAQVFSIGNQSSKDAVLDLSEDSQTALLLPRLTTTQRNAIKSPAEGLIIYNSTLKTIEVFTNNPRWQTLQNDVLGPSSGTALPGGGMIISDDPAAVVSQVAMLEVKSTTKGLLLPSTVPSGVLNPRAGVIVYNPNSKKVEMYANNQWAKLKQANVSGTPPSGENTTNTGVLIADSKTEGEPHHSALLEIRSTTGRKGFMLPSLTNSQRDDLTRVAGLVIFNKETEKINYCDGTDWRVILDEACIPSVAASAIVSNPAVICDGDMATLSISGGSLGDGAEWHWYDDKCDGNLIGTGANIDVYPSVTTTYYARAVGDCGITACVSYQLVVNYVPLNVSVDFSVNPICTESNLTLLSSASNNIDSWTWTGPNSYSSNQNNAVVPSVQANAQGQYTLVAINQCGPADAVSTEALVVQPAKPGTPTSAGNHARCYAGVVWKWNATANAEGYMFNTQNEYSTATDVGNVTSYSHIADYDPNTEYTVYVWAYNDCDHSDNPLALVYTTPNPFACGNNFVDCKDEIEYKTVQMGTQCWMAENLKYLPMVHHPTGYASTTEPRYYVNGYEGTSVAAAKANTVKGVNVYEVYGALYNWPAAMNGAASSTAVPSGVQGLCPHGWHLPSDNEVKTMEVWAGMCTGTVSNPDFGKGCVENMDFRGTVNDNLGVGKSLKSTSGWAIPNGIVATLSPNPNGSNEFGFNFLPGGGYDKGKFTTTNPLDATEELSSMGAGGGFITTTASGSNAIYRLFTVMKSGISVFGIIVPLKQHPHAVGREAQARSMGASIRCIKN